MDENQELTSKVQRPFFLSILCMAIFAYSTLFVLLFLTGIVFNSWITNVLNDFLADGNVKHSFILIFSILGIVLYSLSFYAAFLIWRMKRKGLYLFIFISFLIVLLPYLFHFGNVMSAIVLFILVLLLSIYFRKMQ